MARLNLYLLDGRQSVQEEYSLLVQRIEERILILPESTAHVLHHVSGFITLNQICENRNLSNMIHMKYNISLQQKSGHAVA
jgi:hypothetical protein